MKRYFNCRIHDNTYNNGTEKAFRVCVDDGRWASDRNGSLWIPKSVCIKGEPNDCGWSKILIPEWVIKKARVDYHRILDIVFGESGEPLFVER